MYRIGDIQDLKDTDPYFDDEEKALFAAEDLCKAQPNEDLFIGVYDNMGNLLHIVFHCDYYTKNY